MPRLVVALALVAALFCGIGSVFFGLPDIGFNFFRPAVGPFELTSGSWGEKVSGKTVFLKMFAPWCGHCKRMKPDWDKLMAEFDGHASTLVAEVDCASGGKSLCEESGVRGYPTIMFGDPLDLQTYKGTRTYDALKQFAERLGQQCSPANLAFCDDAKKARIKEFMSMSQADRDKVIKLQEAALAKVISDFEAFSEDLQSKYSEAQATMGSESDFEVFVEGLQKTLNEANKKKENDVEAIRASGLGLLKSVRAYMEKTDSTEL